MQGLLSVSKLNKLSNQFIEFLLLSLSTKTFAAYTHWNCFIEMLQTSIKGQLSKIFERKIVIIFLSISLNLCFGCSKEPSHRDGSFEYPQHMFWLKNKNNNFQLRTLIWRHEHYKKCFC